MSPHLASLVKEQLQHLVSSKSKRETENDRQLLQRYGKAKDEQAFKQLVLRHGAMVMGVARRVLSDYQAAEDVLQATFMVLARKAKWHGWKRSIAPWLYVTAYRLACNARKRNKKQAQTLALSPEPLEVSRSEELTEACQLLDAELMRLSKLYRGPLILCYLEGKARDEAAEQLDISLATLKRRLAQGRSILRAHLERKGIAWSALGWSIFLADQKLPAAAIETVVHAVAKVRLLPALFIIGSGFTWWILGSFLMLSILGFMGSRLLHKDQGDDAPPLVALSVQAVKPDSLPEGSIRRFGSMDFRLSQRGVRFSPDGKYFVTNRGKALVYIDPESGREVRRLIQAPYNIQQWAISPDGKTALVYGDTYWNLPDSAGAGPIPWFRLELWDLTTGSLLRPVNWRIHGAWQSSPKEAFGYFAPDGKSVITNEGVGSETTTLWDVETGNELWQQSGTSLGFIDSGKNVVTYTTDHQKSGRIHILDATTGKELRVFDAAAEIGMGWDKVLSPDGNTVFLGSTWDNLRDYRVRSWNIQTGNEETPLKGHEMWVTRLAVSPDNRLVATISQDLTIRIWDRVQGKCLNTIKIAPRDFNNLAFHPDSKSLWVMFNNWPQRYDVSTGELMTTGNPGHEGNIIALAFAADGRTLWTTSYDRTTRTWDVTTGRELQRRQDSSLGRVVKAAISDDLACIAFSGQQDVAINVQRFRVAVHELSTGKLIRTYETHYPGGELSFSPDHQLLALNTHNMLVWSLDKDRELYESKDIVDNYSFAWTADGAQLVGMGRGNDEREREAGATTGVWNARTGQKERMFSQERYHHLAFSPHGQTLALARSGKIIQLVEFATGQERCKIGELPVNAGKMIFSPDGRWLAANMDRRIWVWNALNGEKIAEFPGHENGVTSLNATVAFSPDSKLIASTGSDCTVIIWDFNNRVQKLPTPQAVTSQQVQQSWEALENPDGKAAFQAMYVLTVAPEQTIKLAQAKLHVATVSPATRVAELVRDLDNSQFTVREKASSALEEQGEPVLPALQSVLQQKPTLELQGRVQKIIDNIRSHPSSLEFLMHLRAIEVLERIGTKPAQTVLARLAEGNPASQRTKDAKAALERLKKER